jgi:hypothetical protein
MHKLLLPILLSCLAGAAFAQVPQTPCERDVDTKLNDMWAVSAQAGTVTYKRVMDRAVACMQGGRCSKPEALVKLQEIMVDEEVIEVQRKKVALMKRFAAQAPANADAYAVAALLPPLISELTALNQQQLGRFERLANMAYPTQNAKKP